MKLYLKHFKLFFIILAVFLAATIGFAVYRSANPKQPIRRGNMDCTTERVFDRGELLTDDQEQSLRALIAEKEQLCGCDIVLVTLNEPVGDSQEALMNWADDFYDQNAFGFNKPHGDGCVLVDNWHSYGDYNGDTWFSTSGKVQSAYSSSDIDSLLEDIFEVVNDNPYEAYRIYVNEVAKHMMPASEKMKLPIPVMVLISLVITVIYFLIQVLGEKAKDTTTPMTYVTKGKPEMEHQADTFLNKTVHKRKIETSSSSGGGGGHISSGGFSHGGGGGHH